MKVGIVIINYNRKELLEKCLLSLEKIVYQAYEVVVVDNGSSDGSVKMVKKKFPNAKMIRLSENGGFAMPNKRGIQLALEEGCEAVLLLNNDTEVDPFFLAEMVRYIDINKRDGMVSAKVLFHSDRQKIDAIGHIITPDGLAKHKGFLSNAKGFNNSCEVFSPYGAAALYHRDLLEDIKQDGQYLDEDFRVYVEDLDLGWRARLRGWKCIYAPGSIVYHHKSATAGAYSELVAFYTNRNILFNIVKNYPSFFAIKAFFLSMIRYPVLVAGFFIGKGPAAKIKSNIGIIRLFAVTAKSFFSAIYFLPKMIKKRRIIQKNRIVSEEEVKSWFKNMGISFYESVYE
jgi:GT2 family glycosyltransferase